jgi:hypothetical protein
MKTFEERYTAYLDGVLNEQDAVVFERDQPALAAKKAEWLKLQGVLKESLLSVELTHPDFFNAQLLKEIARSPRNPHTMGGRWFGIPRLAWGGLGALTAGLVLFITLIPHGDLSDPGSGYVADVLKTNIVDPKVTVTVDSEKGITIIRLDGLEKVPADEDLTR